MNAREKAWTYYRDVVLEKSGEMICGEIFLKMAAMLVCGEFLFCKNVVYQTKTDGTSIFNPEILRRRRR